MLGSWICEHYNIKFSLGLISFSQNTPITPIAGFFSFRFRCDVQAHGTLDPWGTCRMASLPFCFTN